MFLLFSLLSHGFLSLRKYLLIELVGSLKQEVGQELSGVFRHFFAQLDETLSEVGHNVVHQVLADGLRTFVKEVTLVLTDILESMGLFLVTDLLGSGIFCSLTCALGSLSLIAGVLLFFSSNEGTHFILLYRVLSNLLLGLIGSVAFSATFGQFLGSRLKAFLAPLHGGKLLLSSFSLVKLLEEGVIRGSDEVKAAGLSVLLAEVCDHLESLLVVLNFINSFQLPDVLLANDSLEEGLDVGLSTVSLSVGLESPVHFLVLPVGRLHFVSWEVLHTLFQEGIVSL